MQYYLCILFIYSGPTIKFSKYLIIINLFPITIVLRSTSKWTKISDTLLHTKGSKVLEE